MEDCGKMMQIVVLLSLWACTVSHTVYRYPDKQPVPHQHNSGYTDTQHAHPHEPRAYFPHPRFNKIQMSAPYPHCEYNGDIMKNPGDRCSYLECHYGNEPWYEGQKKAQLYARIRQCPPGTAIAKDAKHVLFRPIQYDPTRRVYQGHTKDQAESGYGQGGYGRPSNHKQPTYEYKNTYADMTAICSEMVTDSSCQVY